MTSRSLLTTITFLGERPVIFDLKRLFVPSNWTLRTLLVRLISAFTWDNEAASRATRETTF